MAELNGNPSARRKDNATGFTQTLNKKKKKEKKEKKEEEVASDEFPKY